MTLVDNMTEPIMETTLNEDFLLRHIMHSPFLLLFKHRFHRLHLTYRRLARGIANMFMS